MVSEMRVLTKVQRIDSLDAEYIGMWCDGAVWGAEACRWADDRARIRGDGRRAALAMTKWPVVAVRGLRVVGYINRCSPALSPPSVT